MRTAESLNKLYVEFRNNGMSDNEAFEKAKAADRECEWREGCSSWHLDHGKSCLGCRSNPQ